MSSRDETLRDVIVQEMIEERFNRKHIDAKIRSEIEANQDMVAKIVLGAQMVQDYIGGQYYASKMRRLAQLSALNLRELVTDILIGMAYYLRPELFTSASAQIASRLKFSTKTEAITTVAELMAVLCQTDAFDIQKESRQASLMVVSRIPLSDNLVDFIEDCQYLPPMVCEPLELTHNFSSGYLTHNDSLILGSGNHHDGDLCLDTLNLMNRVPLALNTDFLCKVEEEPSEDHRLEMQKDPALAEQWLRYKKQSYRFYHLMVSSGNRFYMTHKVDKRGRTYACGYHINPQGAPFKKAMIDFAHKEKVEGVPTS